MSQLNVTTKRLALAASLCAMVASATECTERQRYGGTLRVELRAASVSLDMREWKPGSAEFATDEKLGALVYDRLVGLDNYGRFQPQLATEWSHNAASKRWQFTLRANVKFSNGTALTATDVVAALQPSLPNGQQISAAGSSVVIQSASPIPDLLEELASGRFFVYRVQPDGTLMGTGPFFVAETVSSGRVPSSSATATSDATVVLSSHGASKTTHLRFRANEETWSGRPFLDAIDVTLGVPPLRQLFDLQLGKADLVELSPELVRRATQDNQRVWSSAAVTFYGLHFDEAQAAAADVNLREALALSLDRQTMANVLLQKQAEPASALLPQWLSGYAFLFTMETNIDRAKEIRASLPARTATSTEPLRLRVDTSGDLAKLLGERVSVNARQAGILVQVVNRPISRSTTTPSDPTVGVHLFSWHYSSLSPRVELETMVSTLNSSSANEAAVTSADAEQLYAREKKLLEERRVLPLVALPEYVGLGQRVRNWMPARWGEWHLADVWLDLPEAVPAQPGNPNATETPAIPPAAASPGAKP
ncbi:MAG TPA: ABC transporter substrate-binding protein [Candidatus Acidoferrum sp.]|nr:ABC transporter substrate-binding protein [Candidatus Acidoferrum sp.]